MNLYKCVVNGETTYCKASSEAKARIKLFHIYKKKYGTVAIQDIRFLKKLEKKNKPKDLRFDF